MAKTIVLGAGTGTPGPGALESGAAGPRAGKRAGARPCASIAQLPLRGRAVARGYVESIKVMPATEAPSFTVILTDPVASRSPSGDERPVRRVPASRVRLVWMGQRKVPGIVAGATLVFEGMVRPVDGMPTVYNPRYALQPYQGDST